MEKHVQIGTQIQNTMPQPHDDHPPSQLLEQKVMKKEEVREKGGGKKGHNLKEHRIKVAKVKAAKAKANGTGELPVQMANPKAS